MKSCRWMPPPGRHPGHANPFCRSCKTPFLIASRSRRKSTAHDQNIGFLCFRIVGEESEILSLVIHPQYRGKGLGKQLMKFYIDFCSQREIKAFYLETGASNQAAICLYRSFSYHPIGIRPKYYQGKEDALLMARRA